MGALFQALYQAQEEAAAEGLDLGDLERRELPATQRVDPLAGAVDALAADSGGAAAGDDDSQAWGRRGTLQSSRASSRTGGGALGGSALGGGALGGIRAEEMTPSATRAAAAFADLSAATMRLQGLEQKVAHLSGAAIVATRVLEKHDAAAELLLGVTFHIELSVEQWAEQRDQAKSRLVEMRKMWQLLEELAAAERCVTQLESEMMGSNVRSITSRLRLLAAE